MISSLDRRRLIPTLAMRLDGKGNKGAQNGNIFYGCKAFEDYLDIARMMEITLNMLMMHSKAQAMLEGVSLQVSRLQYTHSL